MRRSVAEKPAQKKKEQETQKQFGRALEPQARRKAFRALAPEPAKKI